MNVTAIDFILVAAASILAVPVAIFTLEVVVSVVLPQHDRFAKLRRETAHRVAVLIPAHNESTGLLPTLEDIKSQLRVSDRTVVVADNCIDDTATVAASAGCEVVERSDPARKGKGYALARGLQHLRSDPSDVVIVVDADCRLPAGTIERLTAACLIAGRPVQANYVMIAPADAPIGLRVAEFAHLVKDTVRPLGLRAIGLPCQLMGTGMAFPWSVISSAELASGLLVEDLKLGLDLARAGYPPQFCPSANLTSEFPTSAEGIQSQRTRWERGHIGMILLYAPRLIVAALLRGNLPLLALSLDVAVPPIILLGTLVMVMLVLAGMMISLGVSSTALIISIANTIGLSAGIFLAWLKYGQQSLPARSILSTFRYVLSKIPLYKKILSSKSSSQWIRTDRKKL